MALPDFVVAGVARAGTTTLYNLLKKHNQIYLPKIKETNFFSDVKSKNKEDYILPKDDKEYHTKIINDWSAYSTLFKNAQPNVQLKGDISPSYMWDLNAAKRIKDKNDNAKIIITLRSPVERTISHYKMNYYIGHENENDFLKAIDKKDDGFWGGGNCYLRCSFYHDAVQSFYDQFGKNNVLVLIYEDWISDQSSVLTTITNFLGIEDFEKGSEIYEHKNEVNGLKNRRLLNFFRTQRIKRILKNTMPQKKIDHLKKKYFEGKERKITMTKDEEKKLKNIFRDDVLKTGKILGKDLIKTWNFE